MILGRRDLIAAGAAAPVLLRFGRGGSIPLFPFGVASGEPAHDGAVIWTRLALEPLSPEAGLPPRPIPVRWAVYADERLARPVRAGTAIADPASGHSVHVELAGLAPDRPYWYRFVAEGQASPVGRTRTAPRPGAPTDRLRFAFMSCQKYEAGRYGAWAHAVADDPDLILFLGDYIYEGKPGTGADVVRQHANPEPVDLPGYRLRYAQYRLDPQLQAAHAAAPWGVTWDDHEVANNYAGAEGERNEDPAAFLRRRAAAYQAYWEFLPLSRAQRPTGPFARLYRTLDWGGLAQFQIVDDRQYRDARPCEPAAKQVRGTLSDELVRACAAADDRRRTILGRAQEAWLADALGRTRARWNVLAQQTLMTPYARSAPGHEADGPVYLDSDEWSGYTAARERVVARWQEAATPNPLVVSGDIHAFAAAELGPGQGGPPVAPEFVGGSITSLNKDPLFRAETAASGRFRFADNRVRGYGLAELTPDGCAVRFRALRDARDPDTAAYDAARFQVEPGSPTIHMA